jgi:hypothetical protein
MAFRRRHKTDTEVGPKPRRVEVRATTQPKEGRVVGEKGKHDDEELERFLARIQSDPRHAELMRRTVTFKITGVEMPLSDAQGLLFRLREMQERKPDQFAALVAIVKPRGATSAPSRILPKALAALKKHGVIGKDGSPSQRVAAVLDAAYVETSEGVVLRDPIIYPGQPFVDEMARLDAELGGRIGRAIVDEILEDRRKKRGKDEGPLR